MDRHGAAGLALAMASAHKQNGKVLRSAGKTQYATAVHRVGDIFTLLAAQCCVSLDAGRAYAIQQACEVRLVAIDAATHGRPEAEYLNTAADQLTHFTRHL